MTVHLLKLLRRKEVVTSRLAVPVQAEGGTVIRSPANSISNDKSTTGTTGHGLSLR